MGKTTEILIVEDSVTQAVRLRYTLEHDGYQVAVASNGVEALRVLQWLTPVIIISDIMMPEMDGFETCRRLKDIPVVLLTALSEPQDVFHALQCGADNLITKPYENQSLLSNLRRILSNIELRRNGIVENSLEVFFAGDKYTLDVSRLQVVDFLLSTYESALQKNQELDLKNQQLKDALESIKTLQANYRQLLETNVDAVLVVDGNGIVRYANPAANVMFTDTEYQLHGKALPFSIVPGDRREMELTRSNGEMVVAEMLVVETGWDGEQVNLAVLRDVTEQVRMREELRQLSLRDQLTGLYNRRGFNLIAEQMVRLASREQRMLFLMYIDMDGMKNINDMLGHQEGDVALCDIAAILCAMFRKADVIGRLGGDEFAVLGFSDGNPSPGLLEQRFADNIVAHNATGSRPFHLSASVGIEFFNPEQPIELDNLLESADMLMYVQKRAKQAIR